jgi:hypothetical protein
LRAASYTAILNLAPHRAAPVHPIYYYDNDFDVFFSLSRYDLQEGIITTALLLLLLLFVSSVVFSPTEKIYVKGTLI